MIQLGRVEKKTLLVYKEASIMQGSHHSPELLSIQNLRSMTSTIIRTFIFFILFPLETIPPKHNNMNINNTLTPYSSN